MDILDKLFNRKPEPNLDQLSNTKPTLTASEKYYLSDGYLQGMDPDVYLAASSPTLMPEGPEGEKLAYINPTEEEILKRSGASNPKMTPEGIPSFSPDDPLKQAAALLNSAAPQGESLAYINTGEAEMLKEAGGAGEPVNSSGVPSFFLQKLFERALY